MKLVYHAGALGDFITALPAIDAWRGDQPAILLGRPPYGALADPAFAEVWDAESAAFAPLFSAVPGAGALPAGIRSALVFAGPDSRVAPNLRALGIRDVLRLNPFPSTSMPIIDFHLAGVGAPPGKVPRVSTAARPDLPVASDTAAIAPGSGSARKNWPLALYEELARLLEARGMPVAWIVGPAERAAGLMPARSTGSILWDSLPLPGLAAALSRCRIYAGNDSGITHLAAASSCATLALFGASDPAVWAPRGRRVTVVTSPGDGMQGLSLNDVWRACQDLADGE